MFKKLHVWTAEAVKHQRSISGVCAPGTLVQPGTGRAPRNEFAMVFQEKSKTSILTPQPATMQVLCSQGHLDYSFDMVIMGAVLLESQVRALRFRRPKFIQNLTTMYKNAIESKYSGLKLCVFFVEHKNAPIGGCAQLAKNMGWPAAC